MQELSDRTAPRGPRHDLQDIGGADLVCVALARATVRTQSTRALRPAGVRRERLLISVDTSPPTPQEQKFLFGWFRLTPPRNKSTCRFYGHFVGVCPNGQLLRVVRCHGVARSFLLRSARLSSSGLTCRTKCRFSH